MAMAVTYAAKYVFQSRIMLSITIAMHMYASTCKFKLRVEEALATCTMNGWCTTVHVVTAELQHTLDMFSMNSAVE